MNNYYDENMLNKFFNREIDIICRDKNEFCDFMNFLEHKYEKEVRWNDGHRPTENIHMVYDGYEFQKDCTYKDLVIRIVTYPGGNLLYGIYEVDDKAVVNGKNVYAADVMNYVPIEISISELNDFLSI